MTDQTASVIISGHAFVQNIRRGRYELGADARREQLRVAGRVRRTRNGHLNSTALTRSPTSVLEQCNSARDRATQQRRSTSCVSRVSASNKVKIPKRRTVETIRIFQFGNFADERNPTGVVALLE